MTLALNPQLDGPRPKDARTGGGRNNPNLSWLEAAERLGRPSAKDPGSYVIGPDEFEAIARALNITVQTSKNERAQLAGTESITSVDLGPSMNGGGSDYRIRVTPLGRERLAALR